MVKIYIVRIDIRFSPSPHAAIAPNSPHRLSWTTMPIARLHSAAQASWLVRQYRPVSVMPVVGRAATIHRFKSSFELLNAQWSGVHRGSRRRVAPDLGLHVDIDFDFVAIGVEQVHAVRYAVIGHAGDLNAGLAQPRDRGAEFVVVFADLEPEVIHPDARLVRNRRGVTADLNEQQLVMRSARGVRRNGIAMRHDFLPSQNIAIEFSRCFE